MFKDIKGLMLDLDDTLFSYTQCNELGKKRLFAFLVKKLKITSQQAEESYWAARQHHQEGPLKDTAASYSKLLYAQKMVELLTGRTDCDLALAANDAYNESFFSVIKPIDGVLNFLKSAKKKGLKTAIVSNMTTDFQIKKISLLKIGKYIDHLITSEEAGKNKPHSDIFHLALNKMQLKRDEVLMIGDDYERDMVGAQKMRITPVYFLNGHNKDVSHTRLLKFKSFSELSALL